MILLETLDFPGIDKLLENHDYYKNIFVKDGILGFKNAELSYDEQHYLHKELGKLWSWHLKEEGRFSYVENHGHNERVSNAGPDDIMLSWHIEHVYDPNPICAGSWRMYNFKTDPENGKTFFVDTSKIYKMLDSDWQNFLDLCTVDASMFGEDKEPYPAIRKHWITGDKVIRVHFDSNPEQLKSLKLFDGRVPTDDEQQIFAKILRFVNDQVKDNLDLRIVHKWTKHDLIMPDVFRLAHSVTGGFDPKDREFTGMWGHLDATH